VTSLTPKPVPPVVTTRSSPCWIRGESTHSLMICCIWSASSATICCFSTAYECEENSEAKIGPDLSVEGSLDAVSETERSGESKLVVLARARERQRGAPVVLNWSECPPDKRWSLSRLPFRPEQNSDRGREWVAATQQESSWERDTNQPVWRRSRETHRGNRFRTFFNFLLVDQHFTWAERLTKCSEMLFRCGRRW
jgi:hypothetical protein